jgi:cob(I)alamin adenosyltransferase
MSALSENTRMRGEEMPAEKKESIGKGYIQVYTGNCKGKTTATLGLAFRAMGYGLKTYIGQFMKSQPYGEVRAAQMVAPFITIEQYGKNGLIHVKPSPEKKDINAAQSGLARASDRLLSGDYNLVVLDEIFTAAYFRLIKVEDILALMADKPFGVELILTGRYAPKEVIEAADLVTEMLEVKHYFQKGIAARIGIEY